MRSLRSVVARAVVRRNMVNRCFPNCGVACEGTVRLPTEFSVRLMSCRGLILLWNHADSGRFGGQFDDVYRQSFPNWTKG